MVSGELRAAKPAEGALTAVVDVRTRRSLWSPETVDRGIETGIDGRLCLRHPPLSYACFAREN